MSHECDFHDPLNNDYDIATCKVTMPNGRVYYYCNACYNQHADKSLPVITLDDEMDLSFGKKKKARVSKKSRPKKSRRSRSRKSTAKRGSKKSSKKVTKKSKSRSRKSSTKRRSKRSQRK